MRLYEGSGGEVILMLRSDAFYVTTATILILVVTPIFTASTSAVFRLPSMASTSAKVSSS